MLCCDLVNVFSATNKHYVVAVTVSVRYEPWGIHFSWTIFSLFMPSVIH